MSTLTKELKVKITADANGLKGALNGISDDISKVGKDFEGLKSVGKGITSVGKALTAGLTLPIVGVGIASTKTASEFQGAMKEVSAISGATAYWRATVYKFETARAGRPCRWVCGHRKQRGCNVVDQFFGCS